jgi:hypothetical protein
LYLRGTLPAPSGSERRRKRAKGWLVIESAEPLDVVAVYAVRGAGDVCVATDRVIPTQL